MAVCLMLAFKYNNTVKEEIDKVRLKEILSFIDRTWHLSEKDVSGAEFGAFTLLNFSLHSPYQHVALMCNRLLKLAHKSLRSYLGDSMYRIFSDSVTLFEMNEQEERLREKELDDEEERDRARLRQLEEEMEDEERAERDREKMAFSKKDVDSGISSAKVKCSSSGAIVETVNGDTFSAEEMNGENDSSVSLTNNFF